MSDMGRLCSAASKAVVWGGMEYPSNAYDWLNRRTLVAVAKLLAVRRLGLGWPQYERIDFSGQI